MQRPLKTGLDFYPMDTNFHMDIKIKKLLLKCEGGNGLAVYIYIITSIYRECYFIEWNEDLCFLCAYDLKYSQEFVQKCVDYMVGIGIFDKDLYINKKILTSHGIQEQYFLIFRLNKRKRPSSFPHLLIEFPQKETEFTQEETTNNGKKLQNSLLKEETEFTQEETKFTQEETKFISEESTQNKIKKRKDNLDSLDYPRDAREGERETKVPADVGDLKVCASIDEEVTDLRNSPIWKEQVFMRFKFLNASDTVLDQYFERWSGECKSKNIKHGTLGEARIHFVNWLIIQEDKLKKKIQQKNQQESTLTPAKQQWLRCKEELCGAVVNEEEKAKSFGGLEFDSYQKYKNQLNLIVGSREIIENINKKYKDVLCKIMEKYYGGNIHLQWIIAIDP